jgi:hypothetical protein
MGQKRRVEHDMTIAWKAPRVEPKMENSWRDVHEVAWDMIPGCQLRYRLQKPDSLEQSAFLHHPTR